jgi:hypothetical protein
MGDNVARARTAHPDALVLHVAGGFHVAWRDGTVAQFAARARDSKAAVVSIVPVPGLHAARPDRDRAQADFLVYAAAFARSEWEDTYAVEVPAELRYRLSVPAGPSLPLLVWLPDRATRPEDAFAYWTQALGDGAAVAVVEPPFPELQDDLAVGGRFAFGDGFRADYGRVQHGLAQIVEYVTRRMQVDPARVLVAGAGDGGAAVLWTAFYGEWLAVDLLAVEPADLARLAMEGLPDQKPAARSLQLVARAAGEERLAAVAADFAKVGAAARVTPLPGDAGALVDLVRRALALPARAAGGAAVAVRLERDLPRAQEWAALYVETLRREGTAARLLAAGEAPAGAELRTLAVGADGIWPVASFADGRGLPLAGGPFGGTTVLVLPSGASDADRAAWAALEQGRAIKKRSPFANLAIANADREPSLPSVLQQLRARGRSRFLVVPATFCADAETMQALRRQVGDAATGLDLSWLPGLGAELVR